MAKSIVIIGAGMGGLAAGIYGQLNGYETQIFEMHTKPGGQCASWKRRGYTFDACVHHFFGCKEGSSVYRLWYEMGAMPRRLVALEHCSAVASPDGRMFVDYYDLKRLRETLLDLAPADAEAIDNYLHSIKAFAKTNIGETMLGGSLWKMLSSVPSTLSAQKWMKLSMRDYAERFSDQFLRRAFSQLVYSQPDTSVFFHLLRHAEGLGGGIQWPVGGAAEFAGSIEMRYGALGGSVHYGSRVEKILVEGDKAVGIRLADGTEHTADAVISNADGRKTIMDMLDGKYVNDSVLGYCTPITDETPFAVDVFLGVDRDLSRDPSSLVLLLDQPTTIAGHEYESLEVQLYGFDPTMAPPGKGTMKVEFPASYSYWKELYERDVEGYAQEKRKVAEQTIAVLEGHFPGLGGQVEVVDVCTLITWERFMGGSQGWFNFPNRKLSISLREDPPDRQFTTTLPGLSDFYLVGVWATMMGSLFHNANSGKAIIRRICRKDGKTFRVQRAPQST
jgi:phytoene dehydrogenase-like protein